MPVMFRTYNPEPLFGEDYLKSRDFLFRLNSANFHFGRWEWIITHNYLDPSGLPKIGVWEDGGAIVAFAPYDCELGRVFLLTLPGYEYLREEMLGYSQGALCKDGKFGILIPDNDQEQQSLVVHHGFIATQDKECEAVYPLDEGEIAYPLPDGFHITSMGETYDLRRYAQLLWKGFNHEEKEGPFVFKDTITGSFERPNVNRDIKIAVVAPDGEFASYCGMWQDERCESALVEPVATVPAYRKMGLGRAAVLEGLRRCAALGSRRAFVGSSQQFYYSIGFRPYSSNTWWERKV